MYIWLKQILKFQLYKKRFVKDPNDFPTNKIQMNKEILRLAIPNIISNITIPLLGLVDTYVAGHLDKTEYIGAIGLATTIFTVIYMAFSFLRMGTSGFTAQAYGADNKKEQADILIRACSVAIAAGLIMIVLQSFIAQIGFRVLNGTAEVKYYGHEYFQVYIWAAPAILIQTTLNGWFVGMQNSKYPMITAIFINIINIVLTIIFVMGYGMQIKGIAYATTTAQYAGLAISLALWCRKYSWVSGYFSLDVLKKLKGYIRFFQVNKDIFIRTMLLVSVTSFFTSTSASISDNVLAANIILMQFFYLFSYIMDGFAYAAEALTGKYVGAANMKELRKLVKYLFFWGGNFAILFTIVYLLWNTEIASFLTNKKEVIPYLLEYKKWILLIPIAGFAAFLWDGIYIGATASKQMRNSMLLATAVFFSIFYTFFENNNNNILWISFIIFLFARGLIQTIIGRKILKAGKIELLTN